MSSTDGKEVDWEFIRGLEGFESKGYVPKDEQDGIESGVTIAGGFDLGQRSYRSLKEFKFSQSILDKLHPYMGLTGSAARARLKLEPLSLTKKELDELDKKVRAHYYNATVKEFEDNSDLSFTYLDSAKQTVIMSVAFQYGSLKHRCPKFFKAVTRNMWAAAVYELENFGDDYHKRRLKEAALLKTSITRGAPRPSGTK